MLRSLSICVVILGLTSVSQEISTKLDFGEESSSVLPNSSKEDEEVEVKHTIVVSTKVKNNNRRGLHSNDESGGSMYKVEVNDPDKESGEVPVVKAYKSVETTQIRTPDTRTKPPVYPGYVAINQNSRHELDFYNLPAVPMQWKPSTFFNNINWSNQDSRNFDNYVRRNRPDYQKFNRRVTDDGVKEFYCRKCRELSGPKGCGQQRNSPWIYETTTPRIKIDGKIAKLN